MNRLFILWFEKIFSDCFLTYPKELLPELYLYYCKSFGLLKEDILAKHPTAPIQSISDKLLFDLIQVDPTIEAIFYYRLEREIFMISSKHKLLNFLASAMRLRTGMELYYSNDIGPGLNVQHGFGIVIGPRNKIGKNFCIHQGVTIGQRLINSPSEHAQIGDNVIVGAGAKIMGNITIGDNVKIGANAVLLCNADSNCTYVGIPAKKV